MNPKLVIKELTFNNGDEINLPDDSITIFVGGNNVGKTAALKNLYNLTHHGVAQSVKHNVISSIVLEKYGTREELVEYLKETGHKNDTSPNYIFNVANGRHDIYSIKDLWDSNSANIFGSLFFKFMMTENRITYSNSTEVKDFYREQPSHPIHLMYLDESLENEISTYFKQAFNLELVVDRFGGRTIYLKVGEKPILEKGETYLSKSYNERIKALPLLKDQGDGMRSFVSILLEMISKSHSSLLIDEPEAFLHPPQARLLGKLVGKLFNERQIFISTHSSDLIKGILESNNLNVNIIRISRDSNYNIPALLNNDDIKQIWKDPILRFSPIIDGLFHEKVIICESDGDCRFFTALLEAEFENDSRYYRISDTLLIPAHGKAKIPAIVKALKKISVPTYSICDFDIFNNISPLKELVEAHEGDWNSIESKWKLFYTEINQMKSQLDRDESRKAINDAFDAVKSNNLNHKEVEKIKEILKISTAWSYAKKSGVAFVPSGNAHSVCIEVIEYLNSIGIFPLLVGELESFDKSISGANKSKWLDEILKKNLKTNGILKEAKSFLHDLVDKLYL